MTSNYVCVHCGRERGNGCGCVSPFDDRPSEFTKSCRRIMGSVRRLSKSIIAFSIALTPFAQKQIQTQREIDRLLFDIHCKHGVDADELMAAFDARVKTLPVSYQTYAEHLHTRSCYEDVGWDVIAWLDRDAK